MISVDGLYIVNYCHSNCKPLKNIMRLTKEKAFAVAHEMAAENAKTTAFYRFADFENYYPRRMKADSLLYTAFLSLGGIPETEHPLSFVLQGSEYLDEWFDHGVITKIPLINIPSEFISFTYGDSMAVLEKDCKISVMTKAMLFKSIQQFKGTIEEYIKEISERYIILRFSFGMTIIA